MVGLPFECLGAVSYSPSIVISTWRHFWDEARYWSKIVIFSYPLAFDAPVGGSPSEYCHSVWYGKARMLWLLGGEKTLMIRLAVATEYRRVMDRRTDILPWHSPRYAYVSCGKKNQSRYQIALTWKVFKHTVLICIIYWCKKSDKPQHISHF